MNTSEVMLYDALANVLISDPIVSVSDDIQIRLPADTIRYPHNVSTPVRMTQMLLGMAKSFPIRKASGMITLQSGTKVKLMSTCVMYSPLEGN